MYFINKLYNEAKAFEKVSLRLYSGKLCNFSSITIPRVYQFSATYNGGHEV